MTSLPPLTVPRRDCLRGTQESASHLTRCADGSFYVVKLQNNPQNAFVPANEWPFCMKYQCRP